MPRVGTLIFSYVRIYWGFHKNEYFLGNYMYEDFVDILGANQKTGFRGNFCAF